MNEGNVLAHVCVSLAVWSVSQTRTRRLSWTHRARTKSMLYFCYLMDQKGSSFRDILVCITTFRISGHIAFDICFSFPNESALHRTHVCMIPFSSKHEADCSPGSVVPSAPHPTRSGSCGPTRLWEPRRHHSSLASNLPLALFCCRASRQQHP